MLFTYVLVHTKLCLSAQNIVDNQLQGISWPLSSALVSNLSFTIIIIIIMSLIKPAAQRAGQLY